MASKKSEMTFFDHLDALRGHLFRSAIVIAIFAFVAFIYKSFIFDDVILALQHQDFWTYRMSCKISHFLHLGDRLCLGSKLEFILINYKMAGQFMTHMIVACISGIILAFPYILYEFWRFLKPALQAKERSVAKKFVFIGSGLFMIGVVFGYYIIAPLTVQFLGNYHVSQAVHNNISLGSYISTVTMIVITAGIVFELPLLVYFLARIGLVGPDLMKSYRKHSIVAILFISAIITPPNVASQVLVAFPLLILYEISIVIARKVENEYHKPA